MSLSFSPEPVWTGLNKERKTETMVTRCQSLAKVLTIWKLLKANKILLCALLVCYKGRVWREEICFMYVYCSFFCLMLAIDPTLIQLTRSLLYTPPVARLSPDSPCESIFLYTGCYCTKRWHCDTHLLPKHESSSEPGFSEENKSLCLFSVWCVLYFHLNSAIIFTLLAKAVSPVIMIHKA